jgi:hypothetical protein
VQHLGHAAAADASANSVLVAQAAQP